MAEDTLHKQFPPYVPAAGEEYMSEKQLAHFRAILDSLKNQISLKENKLKELLGDAEEGSTDRFRVIWKSTSGRASVPLAKVKKSAPDIYRLLEDKGFISYGKPSRRFSIKEK